MLHTRMLVAACILCLGSVVNLSAQERLIPNGREIAGPEAVELLQQAAHSIRQNRERIHAWQGNVLVDAEDGGEKHQYSAAILKDYVGQRSTLHFTMKGRMYVVAPDNPTPSEREHLIDRQVILTPEELIHADRIELSKLQASADELPPPTRHIHKANVADAKKVLEGFAYDPLEICQHGQAADEMLLRRIDGNGTALRNTRVYIGELDGNRSFETLVRYSNGPADHLDVRCLFSEADDFHLVQAWSRDTRGETTQRTIRYEQIADVRAPVECVVTRIAADGKQTYFRRYRFTETVLNLPVSETDFSLAALSLTEGDILQPTETSAGQIFMEGRFVSIEEAMRHVETRKERTMHRLLIAGGVIGGLALLLLISVAILHWQPSKPCHRL